MGKTNAERRVAWRERKKAQDGQESQDYWMKERKRDVDRCKAWSNAKRAKEAKASMQRKQACRQRIAAAGKHPDVDKSADESQSFKSPASLGKAVAKLKQRLPRSPRKQVAVICHLAVMTKVMPNQSKERHTPIETEWDTHQLTLSQLKPSTAGMISAERHRVWKTM